MLSTCCLPRLSTKKVTGRILGPIIGMELLQFSCNKGIFREIHNNNNNNNNNNKVLQLTQVYLIENFTFKKEHKKQKHIRIQKYILQS